MAKLYLKLTFWMLRSILSGKWNRNLNLVRTLRAFLVESALSFRPSTSWNKPSAQDLASGKMKQIHMKQMLVNLKVQDWNKFTMLTNLNNFNNNKALHWEKKEYIAFLIIRKHSHISASAHSFANYKETLTH